jgi:hypothetical protein
MSEPIAEGRYTVNPADPTNVVTTNAVWAEGATVERLSIGKVAIHLQVSSVANNRWEGQATLAAQFLEVAPPAVQPPAVPAAPTAGVTFMYDWQDPCTLIVWSILNNGTLIDAPFSFLVDRKG